MNEGNGTKQRQTTKAIKTTENIERKSKKKKKKKKKKKNERKRERER